MGHLGRNFALVTPSLIKLGGGRVVRPGAGLGAWFTFGIGLAFAACSPPPEATNPGQQPRLSLHRAMRPTPAEGFALALEPRSFTFPADHGPHLEYQTEWWYFTGNLANGGPTADSATTGGSTPGNQAGDGHRFGYQLTFFRSAIRPPGTVVSGKESAWRADQVYMAHFALTDVDAGRFHAFERFSRGALDLAGARATPFRVWLENWIATGPPEGEAIFPIELRAESNGVRIELQLDSGKQAILQGDAGLSRKGTEPGNASYYYSLTRLPTRGRISIDGRQVEVAGSSWLDREWSTSALEPGVAGWDWFALQLADGRELMYYRLRRSDGSLDEASGGSVVEPDGSYRVLSATDVTVTELDTWASPATASVYPSRWHLTSAIAALDVEVRPLVAAQEHTSTVVYWEGAVAVEGQSGSQAVTGNGYVELTGYEPEQTPTDSTP